MPEPATSTTATTSTSVSSSSSGLIGGVVGGLIVAGLILAALLMMTVVVAMVINRSRKHSMNGGLNSKPWTLTNLVQFEKAHALPKFGTDIASWKLYL